MVKLPAPASRPQASTHLCPRRQVLRCVDFHAANVVGEDAVEKAEAAHDGAVQAGRAYEHVEVAVPAVVQDDDMSGTTKQEVLGLGCDPGDRLLVREVP